ncbi:hypothetical protein VTL71DRAFT_4859 [Oculimacula yallundae]|uniref:Uncharacterized protein n=1 Tax=Oculimacula yallundae TaxID=86028 RepID=A0ABR4C355_9HELO
MLRRLLSPTLRKSVLSAAAHMIGLAQLSTRALTEGITKFMNTPRIERPRHTLSPHRPSEEDSKTSQRVYNVAPTHMTPIRNVRFTEISARTLKERVKFYLNAPRVEEQPQRIRPHYQGAEGKPTSPAFILACCLFAISSLIRNDVFNRMWCVVQRGNDNWTEKYDRLKQARNDWNLKSTPEEELPSGCERSSDIMKMSKWAWIVERIRELEREKDLSETGR